MIRNVAQTLQRIRRSMEAGRRELAITDRIAYDSNTWTTAKWRRVLWYHDRLNKIAYGKSPWR